MLDEEALKRIRQTLPQNIRDKVKLGKNGLIDKKGINKIKSDDENFKDLKMMVNSSKRLEVGTASEVTGVGEFYYKSAEVAKKETTDALIKNGFTAAEAAEIAKDSIPEFLLGYTMSPEETDTGNMRVLIPDGTGATSSAPVEQMVVTAGHEIYGHGGLFVQGKPWKHDDGGPVDAHIIKVQDRTRNNYRGQQATPSNQQTKKPPQ